MSGRKPIIGISTYQEQASWRGWHRHASVVPTDFVGAILDVGGIPVLLPPSGDEPEARAVAAELDGLLLVGGADIDPARYGEDGSSACTGLDPARDRWETALLSVALDGDLAVLGVCRGMQLINVVLGGTLERHLPDLIGHDGHQPAEPVFAENVIELDESRLPGAVLGPKVVMACYHHQSVRDLGAGVVATGWSQEGVIETISVPDRRFVVGVQGHPEVGGDRRLFADLVRAARADIERNEEECPQ